MRMKVLGASLVAMLFLFLIASPASAALNARALGMGGAYLAVVNNAGAAYLNPAALTQLEGPQLTFDYGVGYTTSIMSPPNAVPFYSPYGLPALQSPLPYLSYGSPTSDSGLAYGLFAYRSEMFTFPELYNGHDGFRVDPIIGQETAVGYSLAAELLPGLSVGASVRLGFYDTSRPVNVGNDGHTVIYDYQFVHIGIDAGLLYKPIPQVAVALVVLDLNQSKLLFQETGTESDLGQSFYWSDGFTDILWDNWAVSFPYQLRWGAAFSIPKFLTVAWDMVALPQAINEILLVSELGAEWQVNPILAFRGGMYHSIFTAGIGITLPFGGSTGLHFDYAYLASPEGQHFISASWLF